MSKTSRWIYQGNSLVNHIRPISPKHIIIRRVDNGEDDQRPRTQKPFGRTKKR